MAIKSRKYFCPTCQKLWKGKDYCCGKETICMGYKWRFPSPNASKKRWKDNLSKLVWTQFNEDILNLYKKYNTEYKILELQRKERVEVIIWSPK